MKKYAASLIVSILIVTLSASLFSTVSGNTSAFLVFANNPDTPQGAKNYNYTDITPNQYIHNYTYGTPHMLRFKNMWMLMNCSRNMVANITADPSLAMHHFYLNMNLNFSLRLNLHAHGDSPSQVQTQARNSIGAYLTIEPNSSDVVEATIGLYIDEETLEARMGRNINPERLSWAFWNGEKWETVNSQINPEGYLVANTDHFSTWTVLDLTERVNWTIYTLIIAVVAIALIASVFVYMRRA